MYLWRGVSKVPELFKKFQRLGGDHCNSFKQIPTIDWDSIPSGILEMAWLTAEDMLVAEEVLPPCIFEVARTDEKEDKLVIEEMLSMEYVDVADGVGLTLAASAWTAADPSVGSGTLPLTAQPLVGPGQGGGEYEGVYKFSATLEGLISFQALA